MSDEIIQLEDYLSGQKTVRYSRRALEEALIKRLAAVTEENRATEARVLAVVAKFAQDDEARQLFSDLLIRHVMAEVQKALDASRGEA